MVTMLMRFFLSSIDARTNVDATDSLFIPDTSVHWGSAKKEQPLMGRRSRSLGPILFTASSCCLCLTLPLRMRSNHDGRVFTFPRIISWRVCGPNCGYRWYLIGVWGHWSGGGGRPGRPARPAIRPYQPSSASSCSRLLSSSVICRSSAVVPPDALRARSSWLVREPRSSTELTSTSSRSVPASWVDMVSERPAPRSLARSPCKGRCVCVWGGGWKTGRHYSFPGGAATGSWQNTQRRTIVEVPKRERESE
jgi:hypothetical protein